ncbi:MAG TPA: glycosyltransferase family 2 protein [Isosphaeraceae bacterium]|nr:glycosyltransferase family 2 protein [Isosphaeraceae bacterium]
MNDPPLISVVLPCRNQADHIARIVPEYAAALERAGMRFELVVVPNASRDATEPRVRALAAADPRVRCVPNPEGGWGLSVRVGLAAAHGEVLAYTNTARTDPAAIPEFIRRLLARPESLVKAARRRRRAPLREVGSWLYNLEARLLFAVGCDDVNGTPKVFARGVYDRLALAQGGDLLDLELIAQASRLGVPVVDVPTFGFPRHGGKSSTTFRSAWRMYAGALGLRLRTPRAVRAAKAETEQSHDLDPNRGRLVSAAPADLLPQDGSAGPR